MTSFRNPVLKKDQACIAGLIGRVELFHGQVDQLVLDHDGYVIRRGYPLTSSRIPYPIRFPDGRPSFALYSFAYH